MEDNFTSDPMHHDEKFWIACWIVIGFVLSIIIGCITYFNLSQHRMLTEMVKSGTDPILASCALMGTSSSGSAAICAIRAQQK